jgi:hypothetical protein
VKYTSALISDARNKLGGDVFARNRAGLYVRVKVKPKNPKTTSQQANRANFATYTKAFRSLTAAQILGWNTLASSSTLTDTLGNSYAPSGLQLYISCNRNLHLIGQSPISNAPSKKPSFPIISPSAVNFVVQDGAWYTLYIIVTSAASAVWTHLQSSATLPLSGGTSFVGQSVYRNLGSPGDFDGTYVTYKPAQLSPVPLPKVGQKVGLRIRLIDPATGYAGMAETQLCVPTINE